MSGNIKFIGENKQGIVQLPTSGRGGIFGKQSNTKGADEALIKFANSFTEPKTMTQMMIAFPKLGHQIPSKEMDKSERLNILKKLFTVASEPKNDEDCSIFIVKEVDFGEISEKIVSLKKPSPTSQKTELLVTESDNILLGKAFEKHKTKDFVNAERAQKAQKLHEENEETHRLFPELHKELLEEDNEIKQRLLKQLQDGEETIPEESEEEMNQTDVDMGGRKSRRRRRRSSKKARRSTNKKRKSRRCKRKSYKR